MPNITKSTNQRIHHFFRLTRGGQKELWPILPLVRTCDMQLLPQLAAALKEDALSTKLLQAIISSKLAKQHTPANAQPRTPYGSCSSYVWSLHVL